MSSGPGTLRASANGSTEILRLVELAQLMAMTTGHPRVRVGLIDGPVQLNHPGLLDARISVAPHSAIGECAMAGSVACMHGTYVAGVLRARRDSDDPGICPGCTLLIRPIFREDELAADQMPTTSPHELAAAIFDIVGAGARLVNLSVGTELTSSRTSRELNDALDYARSRGTIVVAAAGNEGLSRAVR